MRVNRNEILGILLISAICINTYYHFTSPAYKYYRDVCEDLKRQNTEFRRRVVDEFIPSLYNLATNKVQNTEVPSVSYNPFKVDILPSSLGVIDGKYFEVENIRGFYWDGRSFKVGDDFFGFPIIGVTPTLITTSQGTFYLRMPPYYSEKNGDSNHDK